MKSWLDEYNAAITICDLDGVIIYANDRSKEMFSKDIKGNILGYNLSDCHPEPSRTKLKTMLGKPEINTYTIEKRGIKKLIRQSPWYEDGIFSGVVEISFEIPGEMPHFIRTAT